MTAGSDKTPFHSHRGEDVCEELAVESTQGLSAEEVRRRRKRYGPNRLERSQSRSVWSILLDQARSVALLILGAAAVAAFATGRLPDGLALVAVILVNALIAFVSEWRATRSMEALRSYGRRRARVRRDGDEEDVAVADIVPGDIVLLDVEDVVPADARLLSSDGLRLNEAALTGESVPVNKTIDPVDEGATLAERLCMVYKGTAVAEGAGEAVVVHTGMDTELGRIAELAGGVEQEGTPLQDTLNRLGQRLAGLSLGAAAVIAGVGLLLGRSPALLMETAIALGIAAIPEGLPVVSTIALARGMWLMARRQAVINRLKAVETLGATSVLMTDKTGTLTENRMAVQHVVTHAGETELSLDPGRTEPMDNDQGPDDPLVHRVVEVGVLCNNASLEIQEEEGDEIGDPTELALLEAGVALRMHRDDLLGSRPEVREVSFDPDVMMMATYHEVADGVEIAVKGAPDAVLDVCDRLAVGDHSDEPLTDEARTEWGDQAKELARGGYRVLAMADRLTQDAESPPYRNLRLLGLVALYDPPRQGVKAAIDACQSAGIRVVMVTGDHADTAFAIGEETGVIDEEHPGVLSGDELPDFEDLSDADRDELLGTQVFARVSPEQKLRLVQLFRDSGAIVAVTGDGVNDAPALRQADIGVAMGSRGTDAARQVADMVLKDDAFSSIVAAVEQGRIIFGNIRRAVIFLLCTNIAEVLAVGIAAFVHAPLPLRPLQILYLNVLSDVLPALALGFGGGSAKVMDRPPRDAEEGVLTAKHWRVTAGWSILMAACVLSALAAGAFLGLGGNRVAPIPAAGMAEEQRLVLVTVSFLTLAFAKLWFVFNLRDPGTTMADNDIVRNVWVWIAIGVCAVLLVLAVYLPGLADILETRPVGWRGWGIVLGLSLLPCAVGQVIRTVQRHRGAEVAGRC